MRRQAGVVDPLDAALRLRASARASSARALCACIRIDSVSRPFSTTQALNGDSVMPALRITGTNLSLTSGSLAQSAPAMTRPWPSRYLVPEWMTKSAPYSIGRCSAGEQKQLSTASQAPARARSQPARRCRRPRSAGWSAISANSSFVFGRTAARQLADVGLRNKAVSTPNLANSRPNSITVEPNTLCEQIDVVAGLQQAHPEQQDRAHPARGRRCRPRCLRARPVAARTSSPSGW